MEFRRSALARLHSPEELDLPVRLARPQGRLVLAVTVLVLAVAGVWAVRGTVSTRLSAPGILTYGKGSYALQSPLAGQVVDVTARPGQLLPAGATLVRVRTASGVRPVHTVAAGRVVSVRADLGAMLAAGAQVATLERVHSTADPLVALVYVPASDAAAIPVGAPVRLYVGAARAGADSGLHGAVAQVGAAPQSRARLTAFLGDPDLAAAFSTKGDPVPVVVRLDARVATAGYSTPASMTPGAASGGTSGATPSSAAAGGPVSMTPVAASVRLSAQHPLDWMLP